MTSRQRLNAIRSAVDVLRHLTTEEVADATPAEIELVGGLANHAIDMEHDLLEHGDRPRLVEERTEDGTG